MKSKKNALTLCFLIFLAFGCACKTEEVQVQKSASNEALNQSGQNGTSVEITSADFRRAIQKSVKNMFQSGVLDKSDGGRYVVAISYIVDATKKGFDTADIKQSLGAALASGRKVRVVSSSSKTVAPQITVAGRITQRTAYISGRKKRQEYYLHLVLTDAKSGLKLWENTTPVVKKSR